MIHLHISFSYSNGDAYQNCFVLSQLLTVHIVALKVNHNEALTEHCTDPHIKYHKKISFISVEYFFIYIRTILETRIFSAFYGPKFRVKERDL